MPIFKELHDKIETTIAERLEHPLTCQEIHELAAAYSELEKNAWMERLSVQIKDEPKLHCYNCGKLEEDDNDIRS